jgi:hypothetical protein
MMLEIKYVTKTVEGELVSSCKVSARTFHPTYPSGRMFEIPKVSR